MDTFQVFTGKDSKMPRLQRDKSNESKKGLLDSISPEWTANARKDWDTKFAEWKAVWDKKMEDAFNLDQGSGKQESKDPEE